MDKNDWQLFWSALEAIGTVGAVILALVLASMDAIKNWIARPVLEVSIQNDPPDCLKTSLGYTEEEWVSSFTAMVSKVADVYYIKLRVANTGKQKAENVEVFASKLSKLRVNGELEAINSFAPMNLLWSYDRKPVLQVLSQGTYKHCTVAHIMEPSKREQFPGESNPNFESEKAILSFDTMVQPSTLSHLVPPGKYHLEIIISAGNAETIKATLEIFLDGIWHSDEEKMLKEGLGVRLIAKTNK